MNKLLIILALAAVLFAAGCTSKTQPAFQGNGVEITLFNAPSSVDVNERFSVDIVMQNTGENLASDIEAELVQKSNFNVQAPLKKKTDFLFPPVPEKSVPGEEFVTSWILTAPPVPSDQTKSVVARVTYDYTSNATSNIYVVPKEQYDEMGAESFNTYSTSTLGPVLISIQPLPAFKIRQGQSSVNALVILSIDDIGGGSLVGKIENFKLTLKSGGKTEDKTSTCRDVVNGEIQLLGRQGSITIRCEFPLPAGDSAISYIVDASGDYRYYIDSQPLPILVRK